MERTEEARTVEHLIADEARFEASLAQARAAAQTLLEGAQKDAAKLLAGADAEAAVEAQALEAAESDDALRATIRAETQIRLDELRRRAAANRERALALLVELATGRAAP